MKTERATTKSTRLIVKTACVLYIIGISIANIDKLRQFIERRIHCTQFTRTHERARARAFECMGKNPRQIQAQLEP